MKIKTFFNSFSIFLISISVFGASCFAIYKFGFSKEKNVNIDTKIPEIKQPIIEINEEQQIVKQEIFDLKLFQEIFAKKTKTFALNYEIFTNSLISPTKIKIHYWNNTYFGDWFYSIIKI
ncbi:hypothetical protein ESOMN_v1c01810 [Williamsoniiplasma somnilux]|uniref:Lipoprotein n=1 Tax=Williamsoniiplasma somnilux TaxID=215578 RepID=A0A2K8NYD5_9MOLU|nr:hypothetical protein [Williamsoniiplasma somnilux]ATZ18566.1 hypothetical protein ESOMN_v1c01810 [Williamsoniiplasma somnilux]